MQATTAIPQTRHPPRTGEAEINGRSMLVRWSAAAERALRDRREPLILELELYFSCLVKKSVHARTDPGTHPLSWVNDRLAVYFRAVTSTACSIETAERLGRQPEIEITSPPVHRFAPRSLAIDFRNGQWIGEYSL